MRDTLNILSKVSPVRFSNALKLWSGFHYSRMSKKPRINALPLSVSVEPTTSCNLRCPECPSGLRSFTRPTGMLDTPLFKTVLEQLESTLMYMTLYFQGEPYLNPALFDHITLASGKNIYTSTSTNAHYLDDDNARDTVQSGLDRLIISIDGTTQDTYEQYRIGGNLERVIEGTRNLVKWRNKLKSSTPFIIFQFLVLKPNEHQVNELYSIADQLGVNKVMLKTAQIYNYRDGSPLIPDNPKFSRYKLASDGTYRIKNKLLNQCWRMWQSCVITWDGKVVPCCFDKDAAHQLGDLKKSSFREIWFGKQYNSFRASILRSRKEIDICKNCTEGTKVWQVA